MDLQDCYSTEELKEKGYTLEALSSYEYLVYGYRVAPAIYSEVDDNRLQFKRFWSDRDNQDYFNVNI